MYRAGTGFILAVVMAWGGAYAMDRPAKRQRPGAPPRLRELPETHGSPVHVLSPRYSPSAAIAEGRGALFEAAVHSSDARVLELLTGADPFVRNVQGRTLLSHAVCQDVTPERLELLVYAGLPVDARDANEMNPLLHAAERCNSRLAAALLAVGACPVIKHKGFLPMDLVWFSRMAPEHWRPGATHTVYLDPDAQETHDLLLQAIIDRQSNS